MSTPLAIRVEGIGAWSPGLVDWRAWSALLAGTGQPDPDAATRPAARRLSAGERRRAPLHIRAAIEVADQAVAMSGRDPAGLPCVFSSAHGDSRTMDYMCAVLADTPGHLSPTRFHLSVHNAAAGYWTIACGSHASSQAITALACSFGAGLLEAASMACAEATPVLLVVHDEPGSGPLGEVLHVAQPFACALVISPAAFEQAPGRLELTLATDEIAESKPHHPHAVTVLQDNPAAQGLPLLEALARPRDRTAATLRIQAAPALGLAVRVAGG